MPLLVNISVNSDEVYWLAWSVLNISGYQYFAKASIKTDIQKLASIVLDNCRANTARLYQSIIAHK
jgi:hypothetical protein